MMYSTSLLAHRLAAASMLISVTSGCQTVEEPPRPPGEVQYEGSSTIAHFVRAAEPVYGAVQFHLTTETESDGGERALIEGRTDLGGVARTPRWDALPDGIEATEIGRDAIAVIVHADNPIAGLDADQLRAVFTGKAQTWMEFGGKADAIHPYIVESGSATRDVFRRSVLHEEDYSGCREVAPDSAIIQAVAGDPGGIGQISFSFLREMDGVRPISVDGEVPTAVNLDYPIARPLYLLWRRGHPVVEPFVHWCQSAEGQDVLMRDFVGIRVEGSAFPIVSPPTGTLVVFTDTDEVYDGGIYYYPHRPYEILDRGGRLLRKVENRIGDNDQRPTRVKLSPGTYRIRTRTAFGRVLEHLAVVHAGAVTEVVATDSQRR